MNVGAPNSPARWLSENIDTIPTHHKYALMAMVKGSPVFVMSGTKAECDAAQAAHPDYASALRSVVCQLDKYRKPVAAE